MNTRTGRILLGFLGLLTFLAAGAQAAPDRPNVLLIIYDDWGMNHAGAYGCKWVNTPNFDRVAREGVLFKNCFTSNPKCSPCRASILTGRNSWQLEEACCHGGIFPSKFAVYPDLLEKSGYFVGLTGKGWGPGDYKLGGFERNPAGPSFDRYTIASASKHIGNVDHAKNFEAFLKERPADKPFCFWMGFKVPHRSYEPGSGLRSGKKLEDVTVPAYLPDTEIVRSDLLDYALEVEWGDKQIGDALKALEASGQLDNTLILVTSDHGMPFPRVKGQIYEDGFHIPLAMRWGAGIKPGRVVDDFVNVRDFAPTFLELAGLPIHPQISGRSLVNVLVSPGSGQIEPDRQVMLVGKERHDIGRPDDLGYPVRGIRTKDFFYVHNYFPDRWPVCNPETDYGNCDPSPTKELIKALGGHFLDISFGKRPERALYRISDDPQCMFNLASDPVYLPIADDLRAQMMSMLVAEKDPRALGNGRIFDTYKYLGGRTKGYETWLAKQPTGLGDNGKPGTAEATQPAATPDKPKRKKAKAAAAE